MRAIFSSNARSFARSAPVRANTLLIKVPMLPARSPAISPQICAIAPLHSRLQPQISPKFIAIKPSGFAGLKAVARALQRCFASSRFKLAIFEIDGAISALI